MILIIVRLNRPRPLPSSTQVLVLKLESGAAQSQRDHFCAVLSYAAEKIAMLSTLAIADEILTMLCMPIRAASGCM